MAEGSESSQPPEPIELTADTIQINHLRARRFLRRLRDERFVAIVIDDAGNIHAYHKGVDVDQVRTIQSLAEAVINDEEHNGHGTKDSG